MKLAKELRIGNWIEKNGYIFFENGTTVRFDNIISIEHDEDEL